MNRLCVNVVELLDDCRRKPTPYKNIAGCDLSYLILVCAHNFRVREKANPKVNELVERFNRLKYPRERILQALFRLWKSRQDEFGDIVAIYQKKLPESIQDIENDAEVEINYRGESLVEKISVSFSFINRLLFDRNDDFFYPESYRRRVRQYYDIKNIPQHLEWSCRFLYALGFLHTLELHKIRTRYGTRNWYDEYANDFCIDHKLQLERIVVSHVYYLHLVVQQHESEFEPAKLNLISNGIIILNCLKKLYELQVGRFTLENQKEYKILNYRKICTDLWNETLRPADVENVFDESKYLEDISHLV
jgi:hypothetical protein